MSDRSTKRKRPAVAKHARTTSRMLLAFLIPVLGTTALAFSGTAAELGESTWNPLNRLSAGHFQVRDPANLGAEEAETVYRSIADDLKHRYALSGLDAAAQYQKWRRYTSSPYRSVTHGRTYLNHYANAVAASYGAYEKAGTFAVGSILAKDSFQFTAQGELRPGPLFLMEKMSPGFSPASGDWRYTEVLPDGSVLGMTKGENSANVEFCAHCHADGAKTRGTDHVFFPKHGYRRFFPLGGG